MKNQTKRYHSQFTTAFINVYTTSFANEETKVEHMVHWPTLLLAPAN